MYIEEVILEGFKSYATRTVISGWDPEFNAITGLNGSGKSNILDAVCFVLGIDNLRQVRATSLQDLIYKRGQTGITKASVTVIFNNQDAHKSPPGYNSCPQITVTRQILLGGKSTKYLVNGHVATQKAVDQLFQSVQLNVNNPHFLIMQGQITKVLNMRPPEILAMVEESAGTRMFEDRKDKALQTMEKKDGKLKEIGTVLNDIIEPKLHQLRSQRSEFVEWKRNEADLERLKKTIIVKEFHECSKRLLSAKESEIELSECVKSLSVQERQCQDELQAIENRLSELNKRRQKESKNLSACKLLEEEFGEAERQRTRLKTQLELLQASLTEDNSKLSGLRSRQIELQADLEQKRTDLVSLETENIQLLQKVTKSKAELSIEEGLYQSILTGTSGYSNVISDLKDQHMRISTDLETSRERVIAIESELKQSTPQLDNAQRNCAHIVTLIEKLTLEVQQLEGDLRQQKNVSADQDQLSRERKHLEGQLQEVNEELHSLKSQVSHLITFDYSLPSADFDKNKVKGVVASLIELPDENFMFASALEVAAGGKLYNVVVDDEQVANALLERGKLTRRVTIIPLSRIVPKDIPSDRLKAALEDTNGQARVALSLIGYPEEVEVAMKFVFGGTFICPDQQVANTVTFGRAGVRSVTVEGDVYEPSGVLTGGASNQNQTRVLEKLRSYNEALSSSRELELLLDQVIEKLERIESSEYDREQVTRSLDLKRHELSLLSQQMESKASGKVISNIESLKESLSSHRLAIERSMEDKKEIEGKISGLEKEMVELEADKAGKTKSIQEKIKAMKKVLQKQDAEYKKSLQKLEIANADANQQSLHLKEIQVQVNELEQAVKENGIQFDNSSSSHDAIKSKCRELQKKLDREMSHLRHCSQEHQALEEKSALLQETMDKIGQEMKAQSGKLQSCREQRQSLERMASDIQKRNEWVGESQQDDHMSDLSELKGQSKLLEDELLKRRKHVNTNVMDMIDRVEVKESLLKKMLATVEKDKSKIEGTIDKLDKYKLEALEKTFNQVNKDFGEIFSELLPGSFARLDKLSPESISAGLEIKVRLGSTWKQSLAELSGGQRSLIALSLILSLLHHRPAPVYILDEVDAALDPSHTANIGRILSSDRFHKAQFVVVSLKEGLWGSANVVFRARFREGLSLVERGVGAGRKMGRGGRVGAGEEGVMA